MNYDIRLNDVSNATEWSLEWRLKDEMTLCLRR